MAIVAYLEPAPHVVRQLWRPVVLPSMRSMVSELVGTLTRLGCAVKVCATVAEADAWVDDERELCCKCASELGRGTYLCPTHAAADLEAKLLASTEMSAKALARRVRSGADASKAGAR